MDKSAADYNSQGLELVENGRLEVALEFFTKAITEDPDFLEAYKNRGETLIKLNRVAEGEKDIQKAAGSKKKPGKAIKKQKKVVEKYNLEGVEDLWGSVLSDERSANAGDDEDMFGLDDLPYNDTYREDTSVTLEGEQPFDIDDEQFENDDVFQEEPFSDGEAGDEHISEEIAPVSPETEDYSAILEYIGGLRQEVAHARLFEPMENSILIIDEKTNDEQVVFFDQLTCLRVSDLPPGISGKAKKTGAKEIIETVDGTVYHELVHSEQDLDNFLICFPVDDQTHFACTLFPKSNIKKRTQDKPLTDILLEKRFISKMMLQKALQEYEQAKSMTLEKIIAQKARIPLAEVETALGQANQGPMQGLQKEEILLISGLVNEEEILDAVADLESIKKIKIGQFLIEKGVVDEKEVYISLAEKHRIPFVDLQGRKFSKTSLAALPESMILNHEILPLAMKDGIILVAASFVDLEHLSEEIIKTAGCKEVRFVLSPPSQIRKIINLLSARRK